MGAGREAGRRQARLVAQPSAALASFVAQSRWEDIPREVQREAWRGLLNFAGCMLAGEHAGEWQRWVDSLKSLEKVVLP